jgi:hypothetical protein
MRVIRCTTTQLVLEQRLIGLWILGAGVAFAGLYCTLGYAAPFYLLGGLCIGAGSLLEYLTPVEICDLDKQKQSLTLIQRRWMKRRIKHYPLDDIEQIRVERHSYLGANFYAVCLHLATGQRLNLTLFPTTDRGLQAATANKIESFLGSGYNRRSYSRD